ncbi:hypothetical protein [Actinokineospora sp. UTMC 2448]|uniref:hypothetical protein n=1 Tax=Actinokineospora sp. UTMC 2448 TaxID=2268449 RepID=UPI002164CBAE|nr:hypothetical protein [Actinokineospora sp. UTMC 2448]
MDFGHDGPGVHLADAERSALTALHPEGRAAFWGARAVHQRMMGRLSKGDVVLFTGDSKVKAIGEVGYVFSNVPFADALWRYSEGEDAFVFVYSVDEVRHVERPVKDLLTLPGFNGKDPLTGQRFIRPEQVEAVVEAFEIRSAAIEQRLVEGLAERLARSELVAVEQHRTDAFLRSTAAKVDIAYRLESALVHKYKEQVGATGSFRTASGRRADLYREDGDEAEVIEAKSLTTREKVREAVAQLLDYAAHSPKPVTRLTGLFPGRPADDSIAYMARLGIDCVYLSGEEFVRVEAHPERRGYMLPVWRGE